ncbi:MAG: hypothetical protein ACRES4_03945, partial [Nevskiales bacterium]
MKRLDTEQTTRSPCLRFVATIAILLGLMTLSGCGSGKPSNPPLPGDPPALEDAKLLIEHNFTDEDTGFQGFADGDPSNELSITGPDG